MDDHYRHTKIIATLGPATESPERLADLIRAGVDVMRLNMAHGDPEWVATVIARVREVSKQVGRQAAVMMDVKGPEIRTGVVPSPIMLKPGDHIDFYTEAGSPSEDVPSVSVNYPGLPRDVELGATVLVDSGLIRLKVLAIYETRVRCEVLTPAKLGSRRHINLPGVQIKLPALTAKDEVDLRAGVAAGIDFVALSFVRQAEDVETLRRFLKDIGSEARIISKIEDQTGVKNLTEIVRASDAIMVARGDLGIEIAYHELPLVQAEMVNVCRREGKPVIVATHLLESMISSPMPTRAEVSDISNAIREQADAIMLSGETTTGAYPMEAVQVFKNVIRTIEPSEKRTLNQELSLDEPKAKMLRSAAVLAQELGKSGIVVFTRSGFLAYMLGSLRAQGVPIFAFTDIEVIFRQLLLVWGVEPFLMEFSDDPETTIQAALDRLTQTGWGDTGEWMVVITNALAREKIVDTIQLRQIE